MLSNSRFETMGRGFLKFAEAMNAIATLWTFLIMFLMTGDVLGRALFNQPITGTQELVRISLVGIVFMHLAHSMWSRRQVRSEAILSRVSPVVRGTLEVIVHFFAAGVFVGIVASSWSPMVVAWKIAEYEGEGALRLPVAPLRSLIILGCAVAAIFCVVRILENLHLILVHMKKE